MKILTVFVCTLALSACGGLSDVVRAGPDVYMVSAGGGMYTQNPSSIRQEAYGKANQYCDAQGQTMNPVSVNERPYALGRHTANIELTFKCQ